jgi:hypothetical protein
MMTDEAEISLLIAAMWLAAAAGCLRYVAEICGCG